MRVGLLCECSGVVREAFRSRGHKAWSCDVLKSEIPSRYHIQGDVRDFDWSSFDLLIAFPPCTRLCNSGVRWIRERNLWAALDEAAEFFKWCLNLPNQKVVVENPIPHKYALKRIGRKYDQIVQPWMFGHGEIKRTCFWLKGVSPLRPTNIVSGRKARVHRESPGEDRWYRRSRFLEGMAAAMAEQWGS